MDGNYYKGHPDDIKLCNNFLNNFNSYEIDKYLETFLVPRNKFHKISDMYIDINDHSFQIFHRNNETVMGDDENNKQINQIEKREQLTKIESKTCTESKIL